MEVLPIVQVPDDDAWNIENLGTKRKFWYREDNGQRNLYKEARPNTGEDWSEVIAAQIATLISIPCAEYFLAAWRGTSGVVTPSIVPERYVLFSGNALLEANIQNYADTNTVSQFRNTQHTLSNIREILEGLNVGLPPDWNSQQEIANANDLMTGYLMLDALIGNTDRHHENWAVVGHRPEGKDALFYLAPTFDHASSLGCHLTDEIRRDRLSTRNTQRNMLAYTNKALSAIYALDTDKKPMSPIEVIRCARHLTPAAADYWLSKLVFVTMDNLRDLFSYLPLDRITPIAAEFAIALLDINRKRLLNLREEAQ